MRRRLLAALIVVSLVTMMLAGWLLGTESGLRFALSRVVAALPEGALEIAASEGRLLGPLRLRGVRYRDPAVTVEAPDIAIDWSLLPLLRDRLQLHSIEIDSLRLQTSELTEPVAETEPAASLWFWPDLRLPLDIEWQQLQLGEVTLDEQPLLQSLRTGGSWQRNGEIELIDLQVQSSRGELRATAAPRRSGESMALQFTARSTDAPALSGRVGAGASGLQLTLANEAASLKLEAELRAPEHWQFDAELTRADLRPWWGDAPASLQAQLHAEGDRRQVKLSGQLASGPWPVQQFDLQLQAGDGPAWTIDTLRLQPAGGGQIQGQGQLLTFDPLALDLQLLLENLPVPATAPQVLVRRAQLRLSGALEQLRIVLDGQLQQGQEQAEIALSALIEPERVAIEQASLRTAHGALSGQGEIGLGERSPISLQLSAQEFDPSWLFSEAAGRINAEAALQAQQGEAGWSGSLRIDSLSGVLRDRPLAGGGNIVLGATGLVQGQLDLRLGESRFSINADPAQGNSIGVELRPLRLQDVIPGARGLVHGSLALSQPSADFALEADLRAENLAVAGIDVAVLDIQGGLAARGQSGGLRAQWQDASMGDFDGVQGNLVLQGSLQDYAASFELSHPEWQLRSAWKGVHQSARKVIESLQFSVQGERLGQWSLQEGPPIDYQASLSLPLRCLQSESARLCLQIDSTVAERRYSLTIEQLVLQRLLAVSRWRTQLALSGSLDAQLRLRERDGDWLLDQAELQLSAGQLQEISAEPLVLLGWDSMQLSAQRERDVVSADGALKLDDGGQVSLQASLPWQRSPDWKAARGRLALDVRQLRPLQLLAPDLVSASGRLGGELVWSADNGLTPTGQIDLSEFAGSIPALGIALRESQLVLSSREGQFQIDGLLNTGEGLLRIEGELTPDQPVLARVRLAGESVRVADTRRLRLSVSPKLQVQIERQRLQLRGEVGIPTARVDLERIEAGQTRSPDVVVLDPSEPADSGLDLPLDVDVMLRLGDAVELSGFGFDGGVSGQLRLRERPGKVTSGRGSLDLRGTYQAYGQDLEIDRGRLLFASGPLDNPAIDLRAQRKLREVTVGILVRGQARRPQLSLWSDPVLDQAETLSYLILGAPLRSATSAEGAQLGQAAAAVGGNLLAAKVGGRLGFDTFGVADSGSLGGAAFTVGKYLSPRLYLSYGVALFDSARAVTLRYLINEWIDVQIESARESRVGINFKVETDAGLPAAVEAVSGRLNQQ